MASKFEVVVCLGGTEQVRGWCVGVIANKFKVGVLVSVGVMASKFEVEVLI